MNGMAPDLPRLARVRAAPNHILRVRFVGERRDHRLDLTGLLARSKHFAPLMNDPKAFARVEIIEDGLGVAWPVPTRWGPLDLSASTLRRIAEEQQPMSGADFARWRRTLGLSLTEAASVLGLGRRTIMAYLKRDEVPAVVAIACRALARDKNLLAAHFVPGRRTARSVA